MKGDLTVGADKMNGKTHYYHCYRTESYVSCFATKFWSSFSAFSVLLLDRGSRLM
jgi:hypothetical protein